MVTPAPSALDRRAAMAALLEGRGDLLVVSGLGSPSYDVHAAGDTDANYYLWGAMGAAALIGLGLAQARPDRSVLVITGDGEQLMGLGGLATIGVAKPGNLVVAVVDNERFGETGMQRSHTAAGVDLAGVALACGFIEARTIHDMAGIAQVRSELRRKADGPRLFVLKTAPENLPRSLPPRDAVHLKNRFRAHLGLPVT
jgi:thiamine pyrophosphate-dependent acetolactate synthase large subunit-like protein